MEDSGQECVRKNPHAESPELVGRPLPHPAGSQRTSQPPSARRGIPEFSELILACRHHLVLSLILGAAVSSTLSLLAWRLTNAPYEAESLVRVRQYQDVVFTPQSSRSEDVAFVRSQEQLVLSPQVLAAALSDQQVASTPPAEVPTHDAIDWLRSLLRVDVQPGAEVLSISALHPSPHISQTLCNAVTRAYLDEITSRLVSDRQRRQTELERAAQEADRRLDEMWAQLNSVASKVGSDNSQSLTIRDEIQLQAYRDYAQQLRAAQLRGNELQSLLSEEQLRIASANVVSDEAMETIVQNHPDVLTARDRVAKIDLQIQQMRDIVAHEDSPRLKRLYADREFYRADLEKLISDLGPQLRAANRKQLESRLVPLRTQIDLNEAEKQFLHSRMAEIDTTVARADENNGVLLEMSRHAVDRQTRLADGLWQSLQELKIEAQSQPRVSLIELAPLPFQANHGKRLKASAAAAGVGWMMVLLGIGYYEWKSCRVRNDDDVITHTARPVFGVNGEARYETPRIDSRIADGAHEAAARLMLNNHHSSTLPSVMITGASTREPRHLVALDLARAFAGFRRHTLLIDCDVHGSQLGRLMHSDQLPGTIQASDHPASARSYIVPSTVEGLDFLPLGPSSEPTPWIDPQSLRRMLVSLREDYHAIVIHGPAMSSAAECLLLASQADQTLFAVFRNTTRWNQLALGENLATEAGISIAGSVLHSGKPSGSVELSIDGRRTISQAISPDAAIRSEDATEESVRESLASIQQDLRQAASRTKEISNPPAASREVTT